MNERTNEPTSDYRCSAWFRNGLPQDNPLPVLNLAPDWREFGVYGKQVWAPVGKPVHLRMRPTAAQGKSVTLSYSSALLILPLKTRSFPS